MNASPLRLRLTQKILQIIILVIFIASCQNSNKKDRNQIKTFDLKELPKLTLVKLSDLGFTDIEYIPFETSDQSLISGNDDVFSPIEIVAGSNYYLIKRFTTIVKFFENGSFQTRIGKVGKGPGEYTVAHDIEINSLGHNIFLVSAWQKKFNVYSESGEFIGSYQMPLYAPIDFKFVDNNIL